MHQHPGTSSQFFPLIQFYHGLEGLQTICRGQTGSNFGAWVFNTIRYIPAHSSTSEYLPDLVASLHTSPTHNDSPATGNERLLETGERMGCSRLGTRLARSLVGSKQTRVTMASGRVDVLEGNFNLSLFNWYLIGVLHFHLLGRSHPIDELCEHDHQPEQRRKRGCEWCPPAYQRWAPRHCHCNVSSSALRVYPRMRWRPQESAIEPGDTRAADNVP